MHVPIASLPLSIVKEVTVQYDTPTSDKVQAGSAHPCLCVYESFYRLRSPIERCLTAPELFHRAPISLVASELTLRFNG